MKRIQLQFFFLAITLFNVLHRILFLRSIRQFLYRIAGYKISRSASVHGVRFFSFGKLSIGAETIVNQGCYLDNRRGITIGDRVVVAHDTKIYTLGHDINCPQFSTKGAPVRIEDYAVLFSNVLVMPGVTIGRGAVVLPGAVVTKNVEAMSIVGGNPAVCKGSRREVHHARILHHYWCAP
jgi:acetyltransferase-like isoleucine patch superfamily enzyme